MEAFLAVSFVRTLLLAAIAVGLGAWLWLVEAPRIREEAKADLLLDVDPTAVEKVRLAYPDGTSIEVVREGDKWKLTAPIAYAADGKVVENFLTTVKETKIERRLTKAEAGALASYGLEGDTGSQARLEVTLAGGKAMPAVVLGNATPVGYEAFARKDGSDEVLVIPLLLQSSAKKQPMDLRAKTMFEGDSTGVTRVTIEKPGEKIELERKGEAAWAMLSPIADAADAESVRSMLDSIATIDAVGFFDGPQVDREAFGLDEGATRFTALRDDGSSVTFTIGKEATDAPAGNYFERASDKQVIKAPDWVATKFSPPAMELREKRLLSCKVDEVRSMTWTVGGESFTIAREGPGKPWTISPGIAGQALNQRIVDNALNGLVLARADAVVGDAAGEADLGAWGLDAPAARLDVQGANGPCAALSGAAAPIEAPAAGEEGRRPPPPSYYVKNAGRSAVMRASEHEYSRLAMKRVEFVDTAPQGAGSDTAPQGAGSGDAPKGAGSEDAPKAAAN